MIYGELEFIGIIDIPRISTMIYIDNTKWNNWTLRLSDEYLQIQTVSSTTNIALENILTVDRALSYAILSKIQNSSKHAAVMVIDYKKSSTLGMGEVLCSMILTGKKSDITNLKYMLMSLLGLKVDPLIGDMKPEDIRLLCLLASGLNSVDILVPVFDGNEELLNSTFASLKKRELVDDYAALTPIGIELVDRVKGVEKKKLGSDVHKRFDDLSKIWDCLDNISSSNDAIKMIFKCGNSMLYGNTFLPDIKTLLIAGYVIKVDLEMCENFSTMDLIIHFDSNFDVTLRARDYSIMIALYGMLNDEEDMVIRILFCFYLGYNNDPDIFSLIHISNREYNEHCKSLVLDGLIDWYSKELTNAGLNLIHKKIKGDISVLFGYSALDYTSENFRKIEANKKECAKKRIMNVLQRRHDNQKAEENLSYS